MEKEWRIQPPIPATEIDTLTTQLGVNEVVARLLIRRGITDFDEAKRFFRPHISDLHDPFLMKDMDLAVNRLTEAMHKQEKVMVYGDYDVDGTTSVALVTSFLNFLEIENVPYIPDRYAEGYGVSKQGMEFAAQNGVHLIITLDCGIKAHDQIQLAKDLGMDVIVCDHHKPDEARSVALAVLDPVQEDCAYPYKGLSGCGVGFKLLQGFCIQNDIPTDFLMSNLDLCAISIGADIVPITGENRVLAYFGMQQINKHPRLSVKLMLEKSGFKKTEVTITDVVFIIAPRINAAGRLGAAMDAMQLLISNDLATAEEAVNHIEQRNQDRRALDLEITKEALAQLEAAPNNALKNTSVVYSDDWHKGVIGIVASRLIDRYYRPTIVFTKQDGVYTGSARSIDGIDVHAALKACEEFILQFGGHTMAAGLKVAANDLEGFISKFEEVVTAMIGPNPLLPVIPVESELLLSEIDAKFFRIVRQFAPFGPGNRKPIFVARAVKDAANSRKVGAENTHLKLHVQQKEDKKHAMDGIGFGLGDKFDVIASGNDFDIVFTLDENHWNGMVNLQLNVKDLKPTE